MPAPILMFCLILIVNFLSFLGEMTQAKQIYASSIQLCEFMWYFNPRPIKSFISWKMTNQIKERKRPESNKTLITAGWDVLFLILVSINEN